MADFKRVCQNLQIKASAVFAFTEKANLGVVPLKEQKRKPFSMAAISPTWEEKSAKFIKI